MHMAGLRGMPRRIYSYPSGMGWDRLNLMESVGAAVFAIGVVLFIVNVLWSRSRGAAAGPNPWGASSLEWSTSSPPPEYNFVVIPVVHSRDPLWDSPPPAPVADVAGYRVLDDGKRTLGTSVLDGQPREVLDMPDDSLWPLAIAVSLAALFTGLLLAQPIVIALFGVATLGCAAGWFWPKAEELAS
jgi:cytochrome c oxidase subunit I+III